KLKSDRIQDFRAYILGGVKYSLAIGSKKNTDTGLDPLSKLVKNVGGFGSYEAGIGCDIYFEFFKLSPEIKMSNSFGNVLVPENHPYSTPISALGLHTFTFSLIFE
ncbi:MAG: PorT family protein, partial [Mucilaginibacter sp.]